MFIYKQTQKTVLSCFVLRLKFRNFKSCSDKAAVAGNFTYTNFTSKDPTPNTKDRCLLIVMQQARAEAKV